MAGTTGTKTSAVSRPLHLFPGGNKDALQALFAEPKEFSFEQAVRILFHAYGDGRDIMSFVNEDLRIRPHLSLAFPTTDVVAIERVVSKGKKPSFSLTVNMLGLYGSTSPLPTFYTEDLLVENQEGREGTRHFLDILNGGFFRIFLHAGWFRHRLLHAVTERHDKEIVERLYALAGLTEPEMRGVFGGMPGLFRVIGPLSQYPRSAAGLEAFLATCLAVPVQVEQCVCRRARLPQKQQCRLGTGSCLGASAILGSSVQDLGGKIAVRLGPMPRESIVHFAPFAPGHDLIRYLVNFYCTEPLEVDVLLVLDTTQDKAQGKAQDTFQAPAQDKVQSTMQNMTQDTAQDTAQGTTQGTTQDTTQNMIKNTTQDTFQDSENQHRAGVTLGEKRYGCLNGDAWLDLPPGREGQAFFPASQRHQRAKPADSKR